LTDLVVRHPQCSESPTDGIRTRRNLSTSTARSSVAISGGSRHPSRVCRGGDGGVVSTARLADVEYAKMNQVGT
jgi:hypothetical protein